MKDFPACVVPPLPDKHRMEYVVGDRFSPEFIERRRIEYVLITHFPLDLSYLRETSVDAEVDVQLGEVLTTIGEASKFVENCIVSKLLGINRMGSSLSLSSSPIIPLSIPPLNLHPADSQ